MCCQSDKIITKFISGVKLNSLIDFKIFDPDFIHVTSEMETDDGPRYYASTSSTNSIKTKSNQKHLRGSLLGRFIFNLSRRVDDAAAVLYLQINTQEGERNLRRGRVKRTCRPRPPSSSHSPRTLSFRQSQFAAGRRPTLARNETTSAPRLRTEPTAGPPLPLYSLLHSSPSDLGTQQRPGGETGLTQSPFHPVPNLSSTHL